MNLLYKKEPNPHPWGRSWGKDESSRARGVVFRENSKLWTKIHTRLTCLSVSSEEGRPTILFRLITIFGSIWGKAGYAAKLHKNALKSYLFFLQFVYFTIRSKIILFFRALFGQLFKKLRELFWKISSNLWKALIHEQGCYFAHIRDGLFFFWSGQMRNIEKNCLQGLKRPNKLFANVIG